MAAFNRKGRKISHHYNMQAIPEQLQVYPPKVN